MPKPPGAAGPTWWRGLERWSRDLRHALRGFARDPLFTAIAVLSLALGIGAATAIFSLVDAVVLQPLAYRQPERLVFVREVVPVLEHVYPAVPVNIQHFRFWQRHARSFAGLAAFEHFAATLTGAGEPQLLDAAKVSAGLFPLLGVRPQLGRSFLPEEEEPGRSRVVVITDHLWRRRFGASRQLVGRAIDLDGVPHTVVGVLPPSFRFPRRDDLGPLQPLGERTEVFRPLGEVIEGWGGDYDYAVCGRLGPGVSPAQARAELDALEGAIVRQQPEVGAGLHVRLAPLQETLASSVATGLYALLAAVGLLLLIVCANLANLILARASARERELGIRAALGASPAALVQQVLTETLLLSVAGGALGVLAATAALRLFVAAAPVDIPRLEEVKVDGGVLLFAFALAVACAWLSGLSPALKVARHDLQTTLRAVGGGTATASRRTLRLRELLVGSEVALSAMLLVLAGLLIHSLWRVLGVDRGFHAERAIAVDLALPGARYSTPAAESAFFDRVLEQVRSLPGVRSAAFVSKLPLEGESQVNGVELDPVDESALDPSQRERVLINVRFVSPGYFSTLGIPRLAGRDFAAGDRARAVAIVSAQLAARLWPGRSPLGRGFTTGSGVKRVEVVGVVADVHNGRLDQAPTLVAYVPYAAYGPRAGSLVIRTALAPAALMPALGRRIAAIDPAISVPPMRTLADVVAAAVAQRRFQMQLAAGFALSALLLAMLGIYGVVSFSVAQRRHEIGVRLALGARLAQVVRLIFANGLRPVALGLTAGMAAAVACGRLVRSLLFAVAATDPLTLSAVALALSAIAVLACLGPALRAARTDPARVLRG